jgi:hypothetical protein
MTQQLKNILLKHEEKEASYEVCKKVESILKEKLDNIEKLTLEEINYLINFQDDDGGFKITNYLGFRAEQSYDFYYLPSYLITSYLFHLKLFHILNHLYFYLLYKLSPVSVIICLLVYLLILAL